MNDEWLNPHEDLFIPGTTPRSLPHPDVFDMRQAPPSIEAPPGSPTTNFNRKTQTLVINFHEHLISEDYIAKSLKWAKTEFGPENVRTLELQVSDVCMSTDGWWLVQYGFERQLDANSKSGLFRWRRMIPQRKKREAV